MLLRSYTKGSRFTVITDDHAHKWTLVLNESLARLARWGLCLVEFPLVILHRAFMLHQAADALIRLSATNGFGESFNDDIPIQCILHFDQEPFLVDPDTNAYFTLEEDELFEVLSVTPEEAQVRFIRQVSRSAESPFSPCTAGRHRRSAETSVLQR